MSVICHKCNRVFSNNHGLHIHLFRTHGEKIRTGCVHPGCQKLAVSHNLCSTHYQAEWRSRKPREPKTIKMSEKSKRILEEYFSYETPPKLLSLSSKYGITKQRVFQIIRDYGASYAISR